METALVYRLIEVIVIAVGISYVIVGSKIGHPIRFIGCWVLDRLHLGYFWNLLLCPPCNAWWIGLLIGILYDYSWIDCIACAFGTCGVMAVIQSISLSTGMQAEEDYNKLIPRRDK